MSPLQIKNQVIMPLDKVRDLGVIIDSKLTTNLGLLFPLGTFPKNFVLIRPRFI